MNAMKHMGLAVLMATVMGCKCFKPEEGTVKYRVSGTARTAQVRYALPSGKIEIQVVSIPFTSRKYQFRLGDTAFIEAKTNAAPGNLQAEVFIDGCSLPWSSRTEPDGTVTASWIVGAK